MEEVQKLCRICAHDNSRSRKASAVINIFSHEGLRKNIADKINCHLPIKVCKGDGLPQVVCQTCLNKLDICHSLVSVCLEAHEKIQHIINDTVKLKWKPKGNSEIVQNSIVPTTQELPELDVVGESSVQQEQELLTKQENSTVEHDKQVVDEDDDSDVWPEDNVNPVSTEESDNEWRPDVNMTEVADKVEEATPTVRTSRSTDTSAAEILVVAIAVTPGNDDGELDATSQLYFVSIDKNEHSNSKERANAAKLAVSLMSDSEAARISSKPECRVCNKSNSNETLPVNESQNDSTEKCPQCSPSVDDMVIFKGLSHLTEVSAQLFKDDPSKNVVSYIGNYSVDSKSFSCTNLNQPLEKCCAQVEVPRKSMLSELVLAMYNQSEVCVQYACSMCNNLGHRHHTQEGFIGHIMENHCGVPDAYRNLAHPCSICFKRLKSKVALKRHMDVKHKSQETAYGNEEVVCDECGKMVLKRAISTHKAGHVRKECQYCHQILAYRTWNRHRRFHENPAAAIDKKISCIEKPSRPFSKAFQFSCEYCHDVLERGQWAYHYAYRSVFGSDAQCPQKIPAPEQEKLDPNKQAMFSNLVKKAIARWNKRRHDMNDHDYNYSRKKYIYAAKPVEKKPKMECPSCHMMLNEYSYNAHQLRHAGKFDLQCSYCEKKYIDKNSLSKHVKLVHLKIGPSCQYCNKYFAKRSKLLAHEALHRGERNFKCPHCPKFFPGKPNVYNHIKLVHEKVEYMRKKRPKKSARPPPLEEPPIQNVPVQSIPQDLPIYFPL